MSRLVPLVLMLATAAACSSAPRMVSDSDMQNMVSGLCAALSERDVEASEPIFYDGPHQPLHAIATMLTEADEAQLAGDLLRSKQRVEASYDQDLPIEVLHANLRTLYDVARQGLEQLDFIAPTTCEELP